jgi:membrane protease YdiL (CAAX protease family)
MLPPLLALVVLAWARNAGLPWSALGFGRPASWTRILVVGVPGGIALKLILKAVVLPLLGFPALNAHYHYLAGNPAALPGMLLAILVGAGFGEETLFRGFLFERLGRWLGTSIGARLAILGVSTALFALAHLPDQGIPGAAQAAVTGLVLGGVYLVTGQLWLPMVLHVVFDLTALALIYCEWEAAVAHWLLR